MEVAAGAMSPLLSKLGGLLVDECNLDKRVKRGIQSLETELTFMHSALGKVGDVPPDQLDDQVRIWAGKVRELSYQIEDAVDGFTVRVAERHHRAAGPNNTKNRVKKFLKRATRLFRKGKDLHQISGAIDEAQDLAKQLAELRQRYGLEIHGATAGGATIDPRLATMYKDVTQLVGIAEPCEKMIKMLTEGDHESKQRVKVVSVVGFGGLGKTTLAKAVYDRIKTQFDCAGFVSVSRNPDMKKVCKDMLYELDKAQFGHIHSTSIDEKQLIDKLHEFLRTKRYLIIIDDIWDEKAWRFIKYIFSEDSPGSQLITTTRIASVSEACCSSSGDMIYRMDSLSNDDSKRLFHKRIFARGKECPPELDQVSEDILKKCGGVPLAIITIASILCGKRQVKPKDQWHILLKSIGRGLTRGAFVEDMQMILSYSYFDLPPHLKTCLLYLSVFPEDHVIGRDRLIWRWVAEGFVHGGNQETSLYELGESYFNELINKSMIKPLDIDSEGRAENCCVHDMVLDLICSISSEENFVTIMDGIKRNKPILQSKVRRLSIHNFMEEPSTPDVATECLAQVRSITVFSPASAPSLSCFEVLRVLDLQGCFLGKSFYEANLRYLGDLLHLRYLGLRGTSAGKLPMAVGKLKFLQTLDLRGVGRNELPSLRKVQRNDELPSSIVQLRSLMCLYFDKYTRLPAGMGNLTSLEELSEVHVDRYSSPDTVKELGYLTELRVLRINLEEVDESLHKDFVTSLGKLCKLQRLDIDGNGGCVDLMREGWVPPPQLRRLVSNGKRQGQGHGDGGRFLTLPSWMNPSSLQLLSHLHIWLETVRAEDVQIIGMLPCLRFLFLGAWRRIDEEDPWSTVKDDAFPCVRECTFFNFVAVPSMFPPGAMPMLQFVQFCLRAAHNVGRGDGLDLAMGHLTSLEQVRVDLWCDHASVVEVRQAEAALRCSVDAHPCRPTLHITRR